MNRQSIIDLYKATEYEMLKVIIKTEIGKDH